MEYALDFSDEVQEAIAKLVIKYHLALPDNINFSERLKKEDPEIVIFEVARKIVNREGSFKDISPILMSRLHMKQPDAEHLAHDIKNEVVIPLAIIVQETVEEAIEQPRPAIEKTKLPPRVKQVEVTDVDENAKHMEEHGMRVREEEEPQYEEEERKVKTVVPQEEKKGPDDYREPAE